MKVEVFCLSSQEKLYRSIQECLPTYFTSLECVEKKEIADSYDNAFTGSSPANAELYMRRMHASMVNAESLSFAIVKESPQSHYYLGSGSYGGKRDPNSWLGIPYGHIDWLFPAVAFMNRMVLVPHTIDGNLHKIQDAPPWLFRPSDCQGVLSVDFNDERSLRNALKKAAVMLNAEIAKLCSCHMLVNGWTTPNFDVLGKLLGVSKDYLQSQAQKVTPIAQLLDSRIVSGPVPVEAVSPVKLEVRNKSEIALQGIRVEIRGPVHTMEAPVKRTLDLPAHEAHVIEFEIKPVTYPFCPVEVALAANEIIAEPTFQGDEEAYVQPLSVLLICPKVLDVSAPASTGR